MTKEHVDVMAIHIDVQQPKKRGRKPKRQRGRRPGEAGDKARKAQDALHVTSFSLGRLQDKPEKDADDGSEGKDNRPEVDAPSSPADTRTDEERRLDEFVKTLRLTKTTALTKVPDVPKLDSADVSNITKRDVSSDHGDVDPEMPVLQKEGLAGDSFVKTHPDISVSVDALNATVTPPPTPPSERVGIEQNINAIDGGKLVETFKSTLASPSVGLKLKINREKVKLDMPITDNEVKPADKEQSKLDSAVTQNVEIKTPVSAPKQNLQSMMLQDALLSARKYKEQLLQNRQTSPVKTPNTASPKPLTTYPDSLKSKPVTMPTPSSTSVKLEPTTESQNGLNSATVINGRVAGVKQERAAKMEPSVAFPSLQYGQMPSMDDMRRLSAMPFKDFMSVMASVYG
ncbi:hypothetical protein MAR_029952 [Mya arenaria]|uniref:Uncharacterized protein n=2 Tax=Mya arenaria TaxID=6604 RepID=A0ABY7DKN7_MYAAR|nr:hypothetical protein MAR_029952 [Mya arenaria]